MRVLGLDRRRTSPLFRLVEQHLEELLRVWPTRFVRQHGPLQPVVERVLRGFLKCGLLEHRSRRGMVSRRDLLTELARAGAEATAELVRRAVGRDLRPGLVVSVATAGDLLQWHPQALLMLPIVSGCWRDQAGRSICTAYAWGGSMLQERHVRLFRNGRNQALRIPRDFELPGRAATLRKEGSRLIVEPVAGPSLLAVLAKLKPLDEDFPPIVRRAGEPVDL